MWVDGYSFFSRIVKRNVKILDIYLSCELLFSVTDPYLFSVNDTRPPPIIRIGPQNQNLPTGEVGFLHCEAYGDPKPQIWWLKDERPINENSRIISLSSGTLQISGMVDNQSERRGGTKMTCHIY